ncbi:MAG: phosphatase PAP2 family protein [Caulobacteraceae bacterium]|nr:phosphatase PAP2 family protein [Caulobacteraceae bacterium]
MTPEAQVVVTSLGDPFVSGVVGLVIMAWLWMRAGPVVSLVFGFAFIFVALSDAGLKMLALDFGRASYEAGDFDLTRGAPSGHAALAGAVFGGAAAIFLRLDRRPLGLLGAGLSLCALAGVAVTRVTLQCHTIADVLAGLALAAAGVVVFERALARSADGLRIPTGGLLFAVTVVGTLALASGVRISAGGF